MIVLNDRKRLTGILNNYICANSSVERAAKNANVLQAKGSRSTERQVKLTLV